MVLEKFFADFMLAARNPMHLMRAANRAKDSESFALMMR